MNVKEKEFRRRYEEMGDLLRICRNKRRMTQQQLAETAHISKTYIKNIESGRVNITIIVYFMICEALGVEPWELIRECWSLGPVPGKSSKWTMRLRTEITRT